MVKKSQSTVKIELVALLKKLNLCPFAVYKDKLFGKGMKAVIIENLPVRHCDTCGESYYDPAVSWLIDEILAQPEKHTVTRPVSVASLAA